MFNSNNNVFEPFEKKVYLSSPTPHIEGMDYIREAYDTNWLFRAALEPISFRNGIRWDRLHIWLHI